MNGVLDSQRSTQRIDLFNAHRARGKFCFNGRGGEGGGDFDKQYQRYLLSKDHMEIKSAIWVAYSICLHTQRTISAETCADIIITIGPQAEGWGGGGGGGGCVRCNAPPPSPHTHPQTAEFRFLVIFFLAQCIFF